MILVVGYLIARAVKALLAKALEGVGMDRALSESDAGQYVEKVSPPRAWATGPFRPKRHVAPSRRRSVAIPRPATAQPDPGRPKGRRKR